MALSVCIDLPFYLVNNWMLLSATSPHASGELPVLPEDTELVGIRIAVTQLKLLHLEAGRKGKEPAQCLR